MEAHVAARLDRLFIEEWLGGKWADCGHPQPGPTAAEAAGCPEIVVRRCNCGAELYWSVDRWLYL